MKHLKTFLKENRKEVVGVSHFRALKVRNKISKKTY